MRRAQAATDTGGAPQPMEHPLKLMAVVCHPADAIDHAGGVDSHDYRRRDALANMPRLRTRSSGRSFPAQVFFMTMAGQTNQLVGDGSRHGNVLVDIRPVVDHHGCRQVCYSMEDVRRTAPGAADPQRSG